MGNAVGQMEKSHLMDREYLISDHFMDGYSFAHTKQSEFGNPIDMILHCIGSCGVTENIASNLVE